MNALELVLAAVVAGAAACGSSVPAPAPPVAAVERVLVNTDEGGVAILGHDPVAYVSDGAPVMGSAEHVSRHGGAVYWFASAEHKATFDAAPARYAPRYGGYCAYAASQNRLSPIEPDAWQILDGELLLYMNAELRDLFDQDPAGHKAKADAYWPGLVARHGQ